MTTNTETRTFQPIEYFTRMGFKNTEELEKVITDIFSLICYLNAGDKIVTSAVEIEKIGDNVFFVNGKINTDIAVDVLSKKKIIKMPV